MKSKKAPEPPDYKKIQRHLSRRDKVLKRLISDHGQCTLGFDSNGFAVLARAIVAQQISSRAAKSISARLTELCGRRGVTAKAILATSHEKLREVGLSEAKAKSMLDLAEKTSNGEVDLNDLHELGDEEIVKRLLPIRGVGRWTAEMFLMFSLGRLDVLPVADYGLRAGVRNHYVLEDLPDKDQLNSLAEPWRPYRTIATWYIWRTFGNVPQS